MITKKVKVKHQCPNCGAVMKTTLRSVHSCEECGHKFSEGNLRK